MHYKPRGFAKSRGRPPNTTGTLSGLSLPKDKETFVSNICQLIACPESLFAGKKGWEDRPRIRDDTAAFVVVRIRVSGFQQYGLAQLSHTLGCPLGNPPGELCETEPITCRATKIARSFRKQKPHLAINIARDWIVVTCTGEEYWKPVGDNKTSASFDVITYTKKWPNTVMPGCKPYKMPGNRQGCGIPDIIPGAARDWISSTCTGEEYWKPVRDNKTSALLSEACCSSFRLTRRDMPKCNLAKKYVISNPSLNQFLVKHGKLDGKTTTRAFAWLGITMGIKPYSAYWKNNGFSNTIIQSCNTKVRFLFLTKHLNNLNHKPFEVKYNLECIVSFSTWHLVCELALDNETNYLSTGAALFVRNSDVKETNFEFENNFITIKPLLK